MMYYEVLLPIFKNYSPSLIYSDTDSFTISYILNFDTTTCNEKDFFIKKNKFMKKKNKPINLWFLFFK